MNENFVSGKVSVIIPTYKRSGELGRAINSVLSQTYSNIEVIVVDDNNDGDEFRKETELFMRYFESDKRVKYFKHKCNQNGSAARNTGIANSDGEFIGFLDDDDFFLRDRVEHDLSILMACKDNVAGICSGYLKKYNSHIYKVGAEYREDDSCFGLLSGKIDYAAGSTLLVKRSAVERVGGFDTSFYKHQDWEFLIKIFKDYKILTTDHIGVVICTDGYRNNTNTERLIHIKKYLISTFADVLRALPPQQYNVILEHQAIEVFYSYLQNGNLREGIDFLNTKGIRFWKSVGLIDSLYYYLGHYIPQVKYATMLLYGFKNRHFNSFIKKCQ